MKKLEELKKLDMAKLLEELNLSRKELFKTKFEIKSGQSKNNHVISNYKKQIARIKTLIKEQELIDLNKKELAKK